MEKHLNPLQKEFLMHKYKRSMQIKLTDFYTVNGISDTAFKKWLKQYEEGGLEGLTHVYTE